MRWDAYLEDGKGDLVFARPIRWLVLMYGGRVVPFVIRRTELAQGPNVQDIRSGSNTYGHRFLTTSGRAGRAIKIKTFDDYEARLLENFVILNRAERESKIRRELETHARKLGGRVSGLVAAQSSLLQEVPDLVEYPSVVAGHFPVEFLQLPEEVLTTTMIHHQHYFPVVDDEGKLKPAFLAVTNMQPEKPEIIARNSERVLTARLRDARFFWDEDRKAPLESRIDRLATILFHKKLGSYREKAERVASLAAWIAAEALQRPDAAAHAELAGRLCKADLATDMVRELTELQGTMGGIYAREEGQPEEVWKAIYYHYLPMGVEADAPPSRQQLGAAAVTWAAVSLADKLDSVVGMFTAGERPTGSRDPLGLRRQAQGAVKILADLPELTGLDARCCRSGRCCDRRRSRSGGLGEAAPPLFAFIADRAGVPARAARLRRPHRARRAARVDRARSARSTRGGSSRRSRQMAGSPALHGVGGAAEARRRTFPRASSGDTRLVDEVRDRLHGAGGAGAAGRARHARAAHHAPPASGQTTATRSPQIAQLQPAVAKFFDDVLVMAEDVTLRTARLALVASLAISDSGDRGPL